MSLRDHFLCVLLPPGRKAGFALLVLLVSLLAHLFIIEWARDSLSLMSLLDDDEEVIQVTFPVSPLTTPPAQTRRPVEPAAMRDPPAPPAPVPADSTPTAEPDISPDLPAPTDQQVAKPDSAAPETTPSDPPITALDRNAEPTDPRGPSAATSSEPVTPSASSASALPIDNTPLTPASPEPLLSRISLPPSAELNYDAIAIKGSSKVEGRGKVSWIQDGRQYTISGEATVLFLSVLSYRSEGYLGEPGILPERYTEKRVGKSATNTHFHRERQIISFSASSNSYPFKGGEQDRGSVFWQLAGLARGNPDKLRTGLSFDLIIAGSRTADPWRVTVNGLTPVTLGNGNTDAWHMVITRPESGIDYQLEVWIAPAQGWYPVKIMYVDRKGTSLGLSLSSIEKK